MVDSTLTCPTDGTNCSSQLKTLGSGPYPNDFCGRICPSFCLTCIAPPYDTGGSSGGAPSHCSRLPLLLLPPLHPVPPAALSRHSNRSLPLLPSLPLVAPASPSRPSSRSLPSRRSHLSLPSRRSHLSLPSLSPLPPIAPTSPSHRSCLSLASLSTLLSSLSPCPSLLTRSLRCSYRFLSPLPPLPLTHSSCAFVPLVVVCLP
ncbi:unnamed protein product [Closterium sp. NIES-65]|nr:unnamed protein product [Closterium sp. NIES-65]